MKDNELAQWSALVSRAIANAMSSLSKMVGRDISVSSFGLRQTAIRDIAHLMGGPDTISVGVYLAVSGGADGHMVLLYEPRMACGLVDMLMMQPPGTTKQLGDMERSALGELGNVVGTSFLNVIADSSGVTLMPSPPTVMTDMAGALVDIIAADLLLAHDHAMIAETTFTTADREISGMFFAVPSHSLFHLLQRAERAA